MRLWLEDKKTKAQRKCVATNIADHVTSGASYALPSDVVVTFLKRAMQGTTPETCHVALQDLENGYIQFKMAPLAVERIDALEANVRDLEEALSAQNSDHTTEDVDLMTTWPKKKRL
ncbi:hypothetical protein AaE_011960 [Aphanomyces astaci]|uniref:Uncharacterized protein n=1 Tax=Aphanomyces astaci TaxID=112090 RepID=A0A6A4ZUP1_APHAT|nr:hypothetical protein AaE_011960 [Aphanomyces astaci]